ncbi:M14 family metallopeptidase [Metabacillus sp. JX24]|uniref:M14 family metallopeptidase n=1 Tax=Metabacillus sp. JX24 TaxID=3240759 RepID=UPI00350F7630
MLKKGIIILTAAAVLLVFIYPKAVQSLNQRESHSLEGIFPESYDEARQTFLSYENVLKPKWTNVRHESFSLNEKETIDSIKADATEEKENLIVLTGGVHGIEGYAGSAMQSIFVSEIAGKLDEKTTGLHIVHAVNPWGMKNERRYNEHNVDLNRNFVYDWNSFDLSQNKDYEELNEFFESETKVGHMLLHDAGFYSSLAVRAVTSGTSAIEQALLTGQYAYPKGVYYGGTKDEPSTAYMKGAFADILKSGYKKIIHIDLHTGYGPRYQMSIFSSSKETMTEKEAEKAFNYPLVFTPDSEDYYVTNGDMTEYFYKLKEDLAPEKELYSTTFEFGTLGDGTAASIQSLKRTIEENQLYFNQAGSKKSEEIVHNRYLELFYPSEEKWRKKAAADFKDAVNGVLAYKNILREEEIEK